MITTTTIISDEIKLLETLTNLLYTLELQKKELDRYKVAIGAEIATLLSKQTKPEYTTDRGIKAVMQEDYIFTGVDKKLLVQTIGTIVNPKTVEALNACFVPITVTGGVMVYNPNMRGDD